MTNLSDELKAMAAIEAALEGLDDDEQVRVLQWAAAKFKVAGVQGTSRISKKDPGDDGAGNGGEYETFAEFYDAATPGSEPERALVGAHWFQNVKGAADVESQAVNTELKQLGHGVKNITAAFTALKTRKPALVIQTRKGGASQQARKRYKVTDAGRKAVERMIAGESE